MKATGERERERDDTDLNRKGGKGTRTIAKRGGDVGGVDGMMDVWLGGAVVRFSVVACTGMSGGCL